MATPISRKTKGLLAAATAAALAAAVGTSASAADLFWTNGGFEYWSTPNAWNGETWTNGDSAYVQDPKGQLVVFRDHSLELLDISGANSATDFLIGIGPGSLTFTGTKTLTVNRVDATISAGIAGLPTLNYNSRPDHSATLTLNPANQTQNYAAINVVKDPATPRNATLILSGESTGNSTGDISWSAGTDQLFIEKHGSGTWEIGNYLGDGDSRITVAEGTLIVNGDLGNSRTTVAGGTLLVDGDLVVNHEINIEAGTLVATNNLRVSGGGDAHVHLFAGGSFQPGISSIDTVTIDRDHLTWSSNNRWAGMRFDLSSTDNTSDLIDITRTGDAADEGGFLKGEGGTFLFEFTGGKLGQTYTLITFDHTDFSVDDFADSSRSYGRFNLTENSLEFTVMQPILPGDTNGDTYIDNGDLMVIISNFTGPPPPGGIQGPKTAAQGDTNSDGWVDGSDIATAISAFTGPPPAPAPAAVPEPASLSLMGLGALAFARRRRA